MNQRLPDGFVVMNSRGKANTKVLGMTSDEINLEMEADVLLGIRCSECKQKKNTRNGLCLSCFYDQLDGPKCSRCGAPTRPDFRWCENCRSLNREYKNK